MDQKVYSVLNKVFSLAHLELEGEISLSFRKFSMADIMNYKNRYSGSSIEDKMLEGDLTIASEIFFNQLTKSSKKKVFEVIITDIDEDGEEIELKLNGPQRMAYILNNGPNDLETVRLLLEIQNVSKEKIDEFLSGTEEEVKKNSKIMTEEMI